MTTHPIPPVISVDPQTPPRVLILGSFPSVKSRETAFFYGHPQNRFWRVMAAVLQEPVPETVEQKIAMLISHSIALWDVISSCEIENSSDVSIRNAEVNDLSAIFAHADIRAVYTNGKAADKLYRKYHEREAVCLPSTSPANAAWSLEKLLAAWSVILEKH
jgi:hypoxanthine-DNA glycosylase